MAYWFVGIQIEDYNPRWLNLTAGVIYLIGYLVEAVSFFFVFALATAEIFEIPACHRAVIEAKRKTKLGHRRNLGIVARQLFPSDCRPETRVRLENRSVMIRKSSVLAMAPIWTISQQPENNQTS